MSRDVSDYDLLVSRIRTFAQDRKWGEFHTPKNLAMAVASEAGELLAEFRWLTSDQSAIGALNSERLQSISSEMADVLIFLVRLADELGVDLRVAANEELDLNETRFPI